jgi:hypothetical protein
MFTIHLFARVFVLVGDLPVHDFHHLAPHTKQWPNAVYARRAFIDAGCPGWPEAPAEIWGLWNAINRLFVFWSSLPTSAGQPDRETQMPPEVFVPFPSISGIVETPYPPSGDFHVL